MTTAQRSKKEIEAGAERPQALAVEPAGIPAELRECSQWVAWRYERRGEKWTKVPIDPKTGRMASSTDAATWASFDEAFALYQRGAADGVGFVFSTDDPFCGVDLDDCLDQASGDLLPWAAEIVRALNSYTEVSPSGTGVKIYVRAKLPPGGNRRGQVEMYDCKRFFCVTGLGLEAGN